MAPRFTSRRTRVATASVSLALLGALTLSSLPSAAAPGGVRPATPGPVADGRAPGSAGLSPTVRARIAKKRGPQAVFVTLRGKGAADAARARKGTRAQARSAARAQRSTVEKRADGVVATARKADGDARELFSTTNAVPGVALMADAKALRAVAARSDVLKISPLPRHEVTNASAAQLTRALRTWRKRKNVGAGVRIGIIDTGVDYTHAMFGGVGTTDAFEAIDETADGWHPALPARARTKIAGGYDFVGNGYDASSDDPAVNTPKPDPNPIDCNGHGTHVAGTTGGYGVTAEGRTFTGNYAKLDPARVNGMRIGPGVAPGTTLYALKVFGCEGSTNATMAALDWALDPNGDGDFSDKLDIVNMSLGSSYSPPDDPLSDTVAKLTAHGVLTVASAGNEGDLTSVGGNPGNAPSALSVGSSVDAMQLRDGLRVTAPAGVAGTVPGQVSQSYPWAGSPRVSGEVAAIPGPNADGCEPLGDADAANVAGKIAWLEWDDEDATRRCGSAGRTDNVTAAGAIGAIFTSELDKFGAGIAGNADIPVFQLTGTATKRLRAAAEAGTLAVTLDPALRGTIKDRTAAITDTISDFTSRGEHGSRGIAGPTVTGPGDTITSAGVGTGNDQLTISGTSMSAPHVAGVAALVKKANPKWGVLRLKAAVMNTATADLWTGPNRTGKRYGPIRVGAGRVDTLRAVKNKVLAYAPRADRQASVVFAPVVAGPGSGTVRRTQRIRIDNFAKKRQVLTLKYEPIVKAPGISYQVTPRKLRIPARKSATATVTMTVNRAALRHTMDPTMKAEQLDTARSFVTDASGRVLIKGKRMRKAPALRVPVVGTAKPASATTARGRNGQIELAGTGVNQGSGTTAYRSFVAPMELGARSGSLPVCTATSSSGCLYNESSRGGDLQYVGAGSDDSLVWFGLASRGSWTDLGSWLEAGVYIDTDTDGEPDFVTFTLGYPGDLTADLPSAFTVDLASGAVVDIQPLNFNWGDVDTNVFDTDVAVLPVSKLALGIGEGDSAPLAYQVETYDYVVEQPLDTTDWIAYDANQPAVAVSGPLFADVGGTAIDYALNGDGGQALLLHLHGLPGKRAEVVELTP